jgi:hypothetical protein
MSDYLICQHEQGTDGWKRDRLGKATGSRAADMMAKTAKGVWSAKRADYMFELAIEKLTNEPAVDIYVSREMQWGVDNEPFARMAYEEQTGNIALESGFFYLPNIAAGCSVDGLFVEAGKTGLLETKCPKSTTHIRYMQAQTIPDEYKPQCLHNIWVSGAEFADFVSFDPRMPEPLQLFIHRYTPTFEELLAHEVAVNQFLAEVDGLVENLLKLAA